MPHLSNAKSQVKRKGQTQKDDLMKTSAEAIPRDDLRTAYSGDENYGPAKKQKSSTTGDRTKARRLDRYSEKTPVR